MSKQEIWELFYGADTAIRGRNILAVLVAALIIGFVIFITYRVTHLSTAYSAKINATNVAITLITAVIMLMISSNIVISLGSVKSYAQNRFWNLVEIHYRGRLNRPLVTFQQAGRKGSRAAVRRSSCP